MRKLLNKRGSVLFLVVVVMAILMVAAAATYYVVRNQHASANVHVASEQSYQTAYSVSEAVSEFIDKCVDEKLIMEMISMPAGTTSDISSHIDLAKLGTATVTIEKESSSDTEHTFRITTTADVNGETTKLVMRKKIEFVAGSGSSSSSSSYTPSSGDIFNKFIVSTGYIQEDVVINAQNIYSDLYFENDYTHMGVWSDTNGEHTGHPTIHGSIYASGSFRDFGVEYDSDYDTREIVIAKDYYIGTAQSTPISATNIYVGGDLTNGDKLKWNNGRMIEANAVYVLGDLKFYSATCQNVTYYVNGDFDNTWTDTTGSTFYVNGDLYVTQNHHNGTFIVGGNVYLECGDYSPSASDLQYGKEIITNGNSHNIPDSCHNPSLALEDSKPFPEGGKNGVAAIREKIGTATKPGNYDVWNAEGYFEYLNQQGKVGVPVDFGTDMVTDGIDNHVITITNNCVLTPADYEDVVGENKWTGSNGGDGVHTLIVDTTVNDEDIYIMLEPSPGKDYFAFNYNETGANNGSSTNILVKGPHSVIFIVPDKYDFLMTNRTFMGHYDLAVYLTGITDESELVQTQIMQSYSEDPFTKILTTTDDGASILRTDLIGGNNYVHNNIFITTRGFDNKISFDSWSLFCGFVYSPYSYMKLDNDTSSYVAFLGGLIVGSYAYGNNGAILCFTTPYAYTYADGTCAYPDLDKKTDVVKHLMKIANNAAGVVGSGSGGNNSEGNDSSGGGTVSTIKVTNLGYV